MKKNLILSSFLLLIFSVSVSSEYRVGRDYGYLSRPLPVKEDGVVDVVEVFWYGCGHCFNLAPITAKWAKQQDESVNYQKMPVTWGPVHQLHAKLFYTIEALGIGDTAHSAVFTAIHKEGNFLASEGVIIDFLEKLGIDRSETIKYMNSFSVRQKVKRQLSYQNSLKLPQPQ